jgi:hypothetical protein
MADIDTRIAQLETALGKGILEIREGDSRVVYQSMSEMREELARLNRQKSNASGGASRTSYASFDCD